MTKSKDLANSVNPLSVPGSRLTAVFTDKISYVASPDGAQRQLGEKLGDVVSVKDYGAEGDIFPSRLLSQIYGSLEEAQEVYGFVTDLSQSIDWAGCQAALNNANGRTVLFPAGIYGLSDPLTMPNEPCRLQGGASAKVYPNFTTDWDNNPVPSWGYNCATIQNQGITWVPGSGPGLAFLDAKAHFSIDSLVFRDHGGDKKVRLLKTAQSHYSITNCTFHRLAAISPFNNSAAHGGFTFAANQVTACNTLFGGALVDTKIYYNTFTRMYGPIVNITSGGGLNLIEGNRCEFGDQAAIRLNAGSRYNVVSGNLFDAYAGYAIIFDSTTHQNVVDSNMFWRNGRTQSANSVGDSHIFIQNSSNQLISNNTFIRGGSDSGQENYGPSHLLSFQSCQNSSGNKFLGNSTSRACDTSKIFYDEFNNSINCIEFDTIDMVLPRDGSANTPTDDLGAGLSVMNKLASSPAKVKILEDRRINTSADISKLTLEGDGPGTRELTNGSLSVSLDNMDGLDQIKYGSVTYSIRRGAQYATAQPSTDHSNGNWGVGAQILSLSPSAGGNLGWIKVGETPDVWKTFGTITA